MPSKHTVTGSNPVGETKLDPMGATVTPQKNTLVAKWYTQLN